MKKTSNILTVILIILLIAYGLFLLLLSVAGLFYIPANLSQYKIDPSLNGFDFFIQLINPYTAFISLAVTLFAIFLALRQLTLAKESNIISKRQLWVDNVSKNIESISVNEQFLKLYFNENLEEIFNYLFYKNPKLIIKNRKHLNQFFNKFVKKGIPLLEQNSYQYQQNSGIYLSEEVSFSVETVSNILSLILKPSYEYPDLFNDLENLYLHETKILIKRNKTNKNSKK